MSRSSQPRSPLHQRVTEAAKRTPICAVVRTSSDDEARQQADAFIDGGLELIEVTFSVPGALDLVRTLLAERRDDGPPFIGMGTVTTPERARQAVDAGSEFIVSPNTCEEVAEIAKEAGLYLVLGALTATEIVRAWRLGADLVKVYPVPPVGGPQYLATVRQPLSDITMLVGGGFGVDEIPAYREAGASAYGIGGPLLGDDESATREIIQRAIRHARGEST